MRWHVGAFADLLALPAEFVAVDIPIGLPAAGRCRTADIAARAALEPSGPRSSSSRLGSCWSHQAA